MTPTETLERPATLQQVAAWADDLSGFGLNLRDWQHEIQRSGVHSSRELARRLDPAPPLLADRFEGGDTADAYLAAYADWLADRAGIPRPAWVGEERRRASRPWFSTPLRGHLLVATPASFRQRNIFTVPEAVFVPKPGRPPVSEEHKREKNRLRQRAFRERRRAGKGL